MFDFNSILKCMKSGADNVEEGLCNTFMYWLIYPQWERDSGNHFEILGFLFYGAVAVGWKRV